MQTLSPTKLKTLLTKLRNAIITKKDIDAMVLSTGPLNMTTTANKVAELSNNLTASDADSSLLRRAANGVYCPTKCKLILHLRVSVNIKSADAFVKFGLGFRIKHSNGSTIDSYVFQNSTPSDSNSTHVFEHNQQIGVSAGDTIIPIINSHNVVTISSAVLDVIAINI